MSEPGLTSYDQVPYDARPRYATHPDCLATLATLLGMTPAPVERCRVLELGCATGGNLFPLAEAHPGSQFVGIDLSEVQVETGRKVARALGLDNLRLEALSILDVAPDFGEFDFIICHGVYSWVPEAVRDKVMAICKGNLAPQGIAYISYNTYPGWYLRAGARDMMNFHVQSLEDPKAKVRQARAILDFMIESNPDPEGTWQKVMRDEADVVRPEGDYYLYHEHLEDENHPVYFHQFMAHAMANGLQFLGDAQVHTALNIFPPKVQETLRKVAPDLLHLEQYLDFLRNRSFRRTLLVHQEVALNRQPGPAAVMGLRVLGLSRPRSSAPEVDTEKIEEFENEQGASVATNHPMTKAAMVLLFEEWPRSFAFEELLAAARGRLCHEEKGVPVEQARGQLASSLVQLFLSGLVGLHTHLPGFVLKASEKPLTTKLIRLQAATGASIANRRHKQVNLNVMERAALALCDGEHDRQAMVAALQEKVKRGEVGLSRDNQPLTDEVEVRKTLGEELEGSLKRLAQGMLLVS